MTIISNLDKTARKTYGKIQKKLPFLPQSPLKSKGLTKMRMKSNMQSFSDFNVRQILQFHLENLESLQSHKDGLILGRYLEFLKQTDNLDGDILELGTYKGISTICFAKFLDLIHSKKKIYTCDVFTGLPYEDKFSSSKNVKGEFGDTSLDFVKSQFTKFKVNDRIEIIPGLFEETLYQKISNHRFSFVLVDCDIYDATKFCLPFIDERTNGIIAFDDYSKDKSIEAVWGETKAVDEFVQEKNIELKIKPVPHINKGNVGLGD